MKLGAVSPGRWRGESGFLCRWEERVALSGAEGEVYTLKWGEAVLGPPQSLPLEFSEVPAGTTLHIAAACVKASALSSVAGQLCMFPHIWNFRSLLPNQRVARYAPSFVLLCFIYCA